MAGLCQPILSLVGLSFPGFVSGILMLLAFAVWLQWLPVNEQGPHRYAYHLPQPCSSGPQSRADHDGYIARVTPFINADVMVRTTSDCAGQGGKAEQSSSCGMLSQCPDPIVTVVGLYFGTLIGNSVLTEIVLTRPRFSAS